MREKKRVPTAPEMLVRMMDLKETDPLPKGREWIYFLHAQPPGPSLVNIGKSLGLRRRIMTIQQSCPIPLKLIGAVSCPAGVERILHHKFDSIRYFGEWFFATEQLLEFISKLPKAEPLPNGLAQEWSTETGRPLSPELSRHKYERKVRNDDIFRSKDRHSRYWARAFSK